MKQGKSYMTIILWIFLAVIVAYFGFSIYTSIHDPLTTATVIEYEAGSGYYATGYVVREEMVIPSKFDITTLTAQEGAHMAAGETIATGYLTDDAQERQSRIQELTAQLEQLDYARRYSDSVADQAALDSQIVSSLSAFCRYVARRDMNSAADLSPELKGQILRRSADSSGSTVLQAQITATQGELDKLQVQAEADTEAVTAPIAGYFSGSVDGYESVLTPERLETITYREYIALEPEQAPDHTAGKLIAGDTWYYLTLIPAAELEGLERGDEVLVTFARDFYEQVTMDVERIGSNEAGYRILVLRCRRYMQNVTLLRQQSADILFNSFSGLRVPKEAVRVDEDGQPGVYILEGAAAKWKNITILHDNGESYVVKYDRSSTGNLWPGDEVIVSAKNLYNGKKVG